MRLSSTPPRASFDVTALGAGDTFSEVHSTAALLLSCDGVRLIEGEVMRTQRFALRRVGRRSHLRGRLP